MPFRSFGHDYFCHRWGTDGLRNAKQGLFSVVIDAHPCGNEALQMRQSKATKTSAARVRRRFGDVIEVPLPDGRFGFLQYINRHTDPPRYGCFERVIQGIFKSRPVDFAVLVAKPDQFLTFFPLAAACNRRMVHIVATEPVAEMHKHWPTFKGSTRNFQTHEKTWYLMTMTGTTRIGKLAKEHYDLPLKQIIDLKVMEDRILSGWESRDEVGPSIV